jgi:hypothetical protein
MGRHSDPGPENSPDEPSDVPQGSYQDDSDYPDSDEREAGYRGSDYPEAAYHEGDYAPPYPDTGYADTGAVSARPPHQSGPPPGPPAPAQHTGDWEGGEWQGGHRSKAGGRRGISLVVIGALVTVVVLVGAVILWRFFGDALSSRSAAASERCVSGQATVAVVVDPSITNQIQTFATQFNKTASPVGDRCVVVNVKSAGSDDVINGFVGQWPQALGDQPALWIPASSVSTARLEATGGAKTVSDSRSLVTSPVLLAIRPDLKAALADQNWGTLPGLQTNPTALDGLNLPGWGPLRLALPLTGDSDASYLAAEAVAAASAPAGAPATAGSAAVATLMAGQPKLADNATSTAMDALLNGADPAGSPVHAVVTTEQQLYQRGTSLSNAKNLVTSWSPPGPTPVADYPTVLLSGSWLSEDQVTAASEFARFLRKPDQLTELAKAGFRTDGGKSPSSDVTSFAPVSAVLSVGDDALRATLASALTAPTAGPATSIMVDLSMSTNDGDRSRLANVTAALNARLAALPPSATAGLTTFNGSEGSTVVPVGPLSDPIGDQPRSQVLATDLTGLTTSTGGRVSFTTLRDVYTEAITNFRPGQNNSVLVITTGPHTDRTLDGPGLQDVVRQGADPNRPVAINVVDFGADPDRATWQAVATLSGGTYQNPTTSDSPDLAAALNTMIA